jgi:hypothetical protein
MPDDPNIEFFILNRMLTEDMPIGAVMLRDELDRHGLSISEAGVGRLLRAYRRKGFLMKMGNQGHVLTDLGRERLNQLASRRALYSALDELTGNLKMDRGEYILNVLIARRAIEVEAAFRAAENATADDVEKLRAIIQRQFEEMELNRDYTEESANFHKAIIECAKVPMLSTLYNFIGLSNQWQNFFIGTFKLYNTPLNLPHVKIFEAIKAKRPALASAEMSRHMDTVIRNAKKLILNQE